MVDEAKNSSGDFDANPVDDVKGNRVDENRESDSVRYDTYRKVLGEKKKYQSELEATRKELDELRERERLAQEQELKEQNKWQEIAERKEQEAKELAQKVQLFHEREISSRKLEAVLKGVGEEIPSKFWGLINLDGVKYDPEAGEFDETSLNAEIQRIKNEMPEIITRRKNANYDPSAPNKNSFNDLDLNKFASMSKDEKKRALSQLQNVPSWMRGQI